MQQQELEKYVNLTEGLERLRQNRKVYAKLLNSFLEKGLLDEVVHLVQQGEAGEAARAAHAMKGTAGNLSLPAMYAEALKLELCLKAGEDATAQLESAQKTYENTRAAIEALLPQLQ